MRVGRFTNLEEESLDHHSKMISPPKITLFARTILPNHPLDIYLMKNPRLSIELLGQVLQKTLPDQDPCLVGHTSDKGMILAAYTNYDNCHVPEHSNESFHTLEIMDESTLLSHKRIMGDRTFETPLMGGEVSICPAYASYFLDPRNQTQGLSFTLLTLDVNLVEELSLEEFGNSRVEIIPQFLVEDTEQIKGLVNIIKQEITAGYPMGSLFLEDIANALIRCVLKKSAIGSKSMQERNIAPMTNNRVEQVKNFLREHLMTNFWLEDLEKEIGISRFYISRLFTQAEGISMAAYLKKLRVEKAQQLLINKTLSIAQIAHECGFHDAGYLNKCFKSLTKLTPSQFREQFQKRIDIV